MKICWIALLICLGIPICTVSAEDGNGIYGRFDRDTIMSFGAGLGMNTEAQHYYSADFRARFLDTAGILIASDVGPEYETGIAFALDIRPVFLARFLTNRFSGRSWEDLSLDSIGLEIGTWGGPLGDDMGFALLIGAGIDMPVGYADGSEGVWIRLGVRWIHAQSRDLASPESGMSNFIISFMLYYRFSVNLGVASWEPASYTPP